MNQMKAKTQFVLLQVVKPNDLIRTEIAQDLEENTLTEFHFRLGLLLCAFLNRKIKKARQKESSKLFLKDHFFIGY